MGLSLVLATEGTLGVGGVTSFTLLWKWKWLFVYGCDCQSMISAMMEFLDLCQEVKNVAVTWGITLNINNNLSRGFDTVVTSHLVFIT
jgi:hypothetical protein